MVPYAAAESRANPSTGRRGAGAATRGSDASPSRATATASRHAGRIAFGSTRGSGDVAQPSTAVSTDSSSTSTTPAVPHQRHSTDSSSSASTCSSSIESSPPTV